MTIITARMRPDGTVVEVLEDGTERPFPKRPMRPMTEEEIEAAALSDPDNPPLTEEQLERMKRVPRVRTLRRALGLSHAISYPARHAARLGAGSHRAGRARAGLFESHCLRSRRRNPRIGIGPAAAALIHCTTGRAG